jgi:hypothetical protein
MVFFVLLQVVGEVVDALSKERNLHIRRASVPFVELKIVDGFRFCLHVYLVKPNYSFVNIIVKQ